MATAKVINCPTCGAAVDGAHAVAGTPFECTFCGSAIVIERDRPPPRQTPQIQIVVASPSVGGGGGVPVGASPMFGLLITAFVLIVAGAVTWNVLRATGVAPTIGKTTLPATCPVNGTITIEDQEVKVADTAIKANVNCKIFVRRSKITAHTVIEGGTNAEITIEDSTLTAETIAIDAGTNAKIKITGKSVIKAEETAIKAGMNGVVRLDGTRVESDDTAIDGSVNAKLEARGCKIIGKTALQFSMNGDVSLRDTTVQGDKKLGMNGKIKEK
ncbi:MAG: hypothetical protein ACXWUG_19385 [Polyangiales bacterium]